MSIAVTILSTLALALVFWNRGSGFEKISTFLYACVAYAVSWLGAAAVLYRFSGTSLLRVAAMHAVLGAAGLLGVIGVADGRDSWWVWPAAACAILYPLGVCAARFWP
jgi:hypothetical protein